MPKIEDDPRVPALQLLLGDAGPDERRALLNTAFGHDLLILKENGARIRNSVEDAIHVMDDLARRTSGESPLGRHAQDRIRNACQGTAATLTSVKLILK